MSGDFTNLCPGSRSIRQPAPEFFTCPQCGNREVEVSCIDWCQYARECIGEEKYNRLRGQRKD